ncbi:MAG: hypothetical protein H6828_06535 [Planctomycetes bacterium]|nr:hypothetical protein [Planctomycetota bacterium]
MKTPSLLRTSLFAVLASAPLQAGGPAVAIVAAANTSSSDCRFTDTQAKLAGGGDFSTVDIINAYSTTPTLLDLQPYAAVIVWSNIDFADSATLGDVLADYVDGGGGVVVATFANSEASTNRHLTGRWTLGYEIILPGSGSQTGTATLGAVPQPGHPIMAGITNFSGGTSSYRPAVTTLTAGSSTIAEWSDGRVLVAEGTVPNRIDLGFYPPSSDCSGGFWTSSTQGAELMRNALLYVAVNGGVGTAYCFGDGTGAPCPCGNNGGTGEGCANSTGAGGVLTAAGSTSVGVANLKLRGAQLQPGQPGLYFQGLNAVNGGLGTIFGDGLRCAGGGVVRLQVVAANASGLSETTVDVGAVGGVGAGDVRRYQLWYRNPAQPVGSPCGSSFNLTNGVELTWQP